MNTATTYKPLKGTTIENPTFSREHENTVALKIQGYEDCTNYEHVFQQYEVLQFPVLLKPALRVVHWNKQQQEGRIQKGAIGAIAPQKNYKSNFFEHDFIQIGKPHLRYKARLPSIVLSQQCCEVYLISLEVVNP